MVGVKAMKSTARGWLSRRPWLLQTVCRLVGKPHAEIAVLRRIIRWGDTVFDVGANTGQYTCLFGHMVGATGAVHAFEPIPPTFRELQRNVARHAASCRIFLNQRALGGCDGLVRMHVPRGVFTEAAMTHHFAAAWEHGEETDRHVDTYEGCQVTTMDRYVADHHVGEIALVKCDVEGAELLVLKGARSVLHRPRPPILLIEVWASWTVDFGYQPSDLFEFLEQEAGYQFYHINERGLCLMSVHENPVPGVFPDFLNFLCVVPSVHEERLGSLLGAHRRLRCTNDAKEL